MIINIIILLIMLILLLFLIFWTINLMIAAISGAPIVYANSQAIIDAFILADLKPGQTVIDLGCGNANSLIIAAKKFDAKGIGVERSPYAYLNSVLRIWWYGESQNIIMIFGNFEKVEKLLPKCDLVYMYLWDQVVKNLEPWLYDHIGPKTHIVSLAFQFAQHKPKKSAQTTNLGFKHWMYLYSR